VEKMQNNKFVKNIKVKTIINKYFPKTRFWKWSREKTKIKLLSLTRSIYLIII